MNYYAQDAETLVTATIRRERARFRRLLRAEIRKFEEGRYHGDGEQALQNLRLKMYAPVAKRNTHNG